MSYAAVEDLLAEARQGLCRVSPRQAFDDVTAGAKIVDIRPEWQRRRDGEIVGSVIIERNHLEWRLHPGSDARIEQAVPGQRWIVVCAEGYASSLAAASLQSLGLAATDIDGGIEAWHSAGLSLVDGPTPVEQVVAADS